MGNRLGCACAVVIAALFGPSCEPYAYSVAPSRAPSVAATASPAIHTDDSPPAAALYATDASPGGSMLASEGVRRVESALLHVASTVRGTDPPQHDDRLQAVGEWLAGRGPQTELRAEAIELAARRTGNVGPGPSVLFAQGGYDTQEQAESLVRKTLAGVPANIPITRYAIVERDLGETTLLVIVVASLEVSLQPVPRHLSRLDTLHLAGSLAARFDRTHLAVTLPNGEARTFEHPGREFSVNVHLDTPGVYKIELLGDGQSGPVVVANFPVYVDVPESVPTGASQEQDEGSVTPAQMEDRLLTLLNADRAKANVGALQADAALATVARAHSQDMADHDFFGHVSARTGTPDDRVRRAHLSGLMGYGENIVLADTPESAHQSLMDSPGHRANMIRAEFTHGGIGAVLETSSGTRQTFAVTYLFGQRVR